MAEFRRHVVIDRPRCEVWEFITNHANAARWMPNLTSIEVVSEGPVGVGSRFRETRRFKGRDAVAEIEVTAWEPPVEYAAGTPYAGTFFEYRYQLSSPTETSTHLELIATASPRTMLGRLASIPMIRAMERCDGEQLASIKRAIEAGEVAARS